MEHFLCREPGNIVVVADLRAMTEVTTTCAKSLRLEKSDGARVQLMMRMRGAQSEIGDSYVSALRLESDETDGRWSE